MSIETEQVSTSLSKLSFENRLNGEPKLQQMVRALADLEDDPNKNFLTTPNGVVEVSKDTIIVQTGTKVTRSA